MVEHEKENIATMADVQELGNGSKNTSNTPVDAPEVHTDSRGTTHRLEGCA